MPPSKPVTQTELKKTKSDLIENLKTIKQLVNNLPDKSFLVEQYSTKSHKHPESVHEHKEFAEKQHIHDIYIGQDIFNAEKKRINKKLKLLKANQKTKIKLGQAFLFTIGLSFLFMGLSGVSVHRAYTIVGIIIFIASFLV